MRQTSEEIIKKIIELKRKKVSTSDIMKILKISKPTVIKYSKINGISGSKNRPGRYKKLCSEAERILCNYFLKNKMKNLEGGKIMLKKKFKINCTNQTVKNYLDGNKIKCCIKVKKPFITERHKKKRMKFVEKYRSFSYFDWKRVVWSDECKFALLNTNGREYCWKRRSDDLKEDHIKRTKKFGGGSIMVWGCITSHGVGKLVQITGIMDSKKYIHILSRGLLITMDDKGLNPDEVIFMHDNDPKHTALRTRKWLNRNKINVLEWPAQSPDMNPIENLWSIINSKIRKRKEKPKDIEELWKIVQEEWYSIDPEIVRTLYLTMTERVDALYKSKGGYTKY
jgi:transposase